MQGFNNGVNVQAPEEGFGTQDNKRDFGVNGKIIKRSKGQSDVEKPQTAAG